MRLTVLPSEPAARSSESTEHLQSHCNAFIEIVRYYQEVILSNSGRRIAFALGTLIFHSFIVQDFIIFSIP